MNKYDTNDDSYERLLLSALEAAYRAGQSILEIYHSENQYSVETKADNSPLTAADRKSHEIICSVLSEASFQNRPASQSADASCMAIPILSEEGRDIPYEVRRQWKQFWLVDPLDGTKEFINRNGEFTVNIALIDQNRPVAGVVFIPVTGVIYFAAENIGAYKMRVVNESGDRKNTSGQTDNDEKTLCVTPREFYTSIKDDSPDGIIGFSEKLPVKNRMNDDISECIVVASRSHMNTETEEFIETLKKKYREVKTLSAGSSMKLCLVAEGTADCYPRLGPTMEWDTAAAHAVARCAGKKVIVFDTHEELVYNKENLLNPWFVVK